MLEDSNEIRKGVETDYLANVEFKGRHSKGDSGGENEEPGDIKQRRPSKPCDSEVRWIELRAAEIPFVLN